MLRFKLQIKLRSGLEKLTFTVVVRDSSQEQINGLSEPRVPTCVTCVPIH